VASSRCPRQEPPEGAFPIREKEFASHGFGGDARDTNAVWPEKMAGEIQEFTEDLRRGR